ncbi:MAG: hypothetical protein KAR42_02065 [candidate division Zixibacteria bacterium]|nr:hypothetical protein [candidate division Zixibacteria bacterium]
MINIQCIKKILLRTFLFTIALLIICWVWLIITHARYDNLVKQLIPGITKNEVIEIMGEPATIDSSFEGLEIWRFQPPRGRFAEWPECYFVLGDSIMVKFWREPISLTLPEDSI